MAVATFSRFREDLRAALFHCGSGRELIARGFEVDVELAAEHATSGVAPMLAGEQFINAAIVIRRFSR
jgi:2-phosphosulfolactate phosphatase